MTVWLANNGLLTKIHAFDAWNITEGSDTVLVGLVDTGIDYLHPDIKNKIYINPGETGLDAREEIKEQTELMTMAMALLMIIWVGIL